ncbi:MAG: 16S rRNA (guanine(966)-N(2))-methyltransferase RsmD [Desulfobulbus sp.]
MRITGGQAKGRRLLGPKASQHMLRPTCGRVREALFNIIGNERICGAMVLDLFAGTGVWGIEALSRGAAAALFVDKSPAAGRLIAANLRNCLPQAQAGFVRLHLHAASQLSSLGEKIPPPHCFDLVFLDPPYQKNLAEQLLKVVEEAHILAPSALVVTEEHHCTVLPARIGALQSMDRRRYGESALWLFTLNAQPTGM